MVLPLYRTLGILIVTACFACNGEDHGSSLNQQKSRPVATANKKKTRMADGTIATWTRVTEEELKDLGIKDPQAFGEAWKDPSGMIWGDIAKRRNGSLVYVGYREEAVDYCKSLGADLPSGYPEEQNGKNGFPDGDSDVVRLRKYLGAESTKVGEKPDGYSPTVIPNLTYSQDGKAYGYLYWSSSISENNIHQAYFYDGGNGRIDQHWRSLSYGKVRCVLRMN